MVPGAGDAVVSTVASSAQATRRARPALVVFAFAVIAVADIPAAVGIAGAQPARRDGPRENNGTGVASSP